ncbi:MAG: hypothetical protein KDK40_05885, partial [Chlamydiia bacterium]|nr:hypothetical protein [Chlamydiia bacterium]
RATGLYKLPPFHSIHKRRAVHSILSLFDKCGALMRQTLLYNEVYFSDFFLLAEALLSIPSEKLKNLTLWLLYREPPNVLSRHRKRLLQIHHQLHVHLKGQICFLAEGDRQCQILGEYFDRNFSVLPIPHGFQESFIKTKPSELPLCVCYGPARPGYHPMRKGVDILQRILDKRLYGAPPPFALVAADDSGLQPQPDGVPLYIFSSKLSREDYYKWIARGDLAIFPYQQEYYDYYTSGIFIEAVTAGVPVLVQERTWLGRQCQHYGGEHCVIDWRQMDPFDVIKDCIQNGQKASQALIDGVRKVHTSKGFANFVLVNYLQR